MKSVYEYLTEKRVSHTSVKPEEKHIDDNLISYIKEKQYSELTDALENGAIASDEALIYACLAHDKKAVSILLDNGANPNAESTDGTPALIVSAWRHNYEIMKILILAGADMNVTFKQDGYYPIQYMAYTDNVEMLDFMIKHGAKTDIKNKNHPHVNRTLLYACIDAKPVAKKCIKYLVDNNLIQFGREHDALTILPSRTKDKKILHMLEY